MGSQVKDLDEIEGFIYQSNYELGSNQAAFSNEKLSDGHAHLVNQNFKKLKLELGSDENSESQNNSSKFEILKDELNQTNFHYDGQDQGLITQRDNSNRFSEDDPMMSSFKHDHSQLDGYMNIQDQEELDQFQ